MTDSPREVVITGVSAVSPIGIGYPAVRASIAAGVSGVRRLAQFDTPEYPVRIGAEILDFDAKQYVTPRKSLKVMSRGIQLAFAAAQMAAEQASLATAQAPRERIGSVFGADMIQIEPQELINAFRACIQNGKFEFDRWDERSISEMYPLWMLKYLPNMPACHVAIAQDARGPNNTIVLAEASSLLAIGEGARVIQRGAADVMIVGGAGSRIHPLSWIFRDHVMQTRRWEHPEQASRPFDARRDGMVYGEGAAALILEVREHAEARRAPILGRILSVASAYEPCKPGQPFAGTAIRRTIVDSLKSAHVSPADIGHVNAHGLGTIHHDRAEAQAIRDMLGDVPVTAMKSYFGNLGAGTGAVELLGTLTAFESGLVPRTLNYEEPDPECPVNVVHGQPLAGTRPLALALNHTSMGQSVAMVLAGPN